MAMFEITADPPTKYEPVGRCIYCPSDADLTDEHIIPFALNGTQILPKASCANCGRITSYLDGFIARSVFNQARTHAGMRTRRKLPDEFEAILTFEDGREERVMVPADLHPMTLEGFLQNAVSEGVITGNAVRRRGQYQFGQLLPKTERGQVDGGIGKAFALGTASLIAPTDLVRKSGETRRIDGIDIVFAMAPESEAPDELYMYYPQLRVLNMAELATHTFHNLLPFRGTVVRDALAWSRYLNDALDAFADRTDVLIVQHHWPVFGGERARDFLAKQRDLYKYVHDQTLRLLNQGLTAPEIAERLELPASLANAWGNRGTYGTVRHNAKAIYQKYLGWYDDNPANLDPLPPAEAARKYVAYMGGADAVIRRAREDFRNGEYRFVAEIANKLVFADPANQEARDLAADAYEQLGYLAESATWRNAYLFGAYELRHGPAKPTRAPAIAPQTISAVPTAMIFDLLAVQLNGPKADGRHITINWTFADTRACSVPSESEHALDSSFGACSCRRTGDHFAGTCAPEIYRLTLENAALTATQGRLADRADASVTLARDALDAVVLGRTTIGEAVRSGQIKVVGESDKVVELFSLLDSFSSNFEIVEPKRAMH